MHTLISQESNQHTTQLQGLGHVYGTPASDLKVGSTIVWNFGSTSVVMAIVKETKSFITVRFADGERRLKKSRIVARPVKELSKELQKRAEYPKDYEDTSDIIIFFKVFPEYITHIKLECYALAYHILARNLIKLPAKTTVENYLKNNRSNILVHKKGE